MRCSVVASKISDDAVEQTEESLALATYPIIYVTVDAS